MGAARLSELGNSNLKKTGFARRFFVRFLRQPRIAIRAQLQRKTLAEAISCSVASACTPSTRARASAAAHATRGSRHTLSCRLMIYKLLYRIPGGHAVQVFTGVCLVLGIGCAPVLYKKTRAGHDYFLERKPEAVERGLEAKQKAKYADLIKRNG